MKQIGRYEIIEKIGFGGTAIVYKAHDPHISRTLAIKVLREERCQDDEYRRRFLREAKAVGVLSHPNIVTIYDVGEVNNTPYIAMELLEGEALDEVMKKPDNISITDALNWGIQLADALSYAHSNGIVHRDIKPSNIVLSKNNTITITDFGIAHLEEADVTQHTQIGEVLGTPQYMSPEQVLGKQADARSDLFSAGVILYQLLSGQKPFQADSLATLLFQIATENPEPIGNIAPTLPSTLKQTIDKLLKKKPEKRFQSGTDLKHALQTSLQIISDSKNAQQNQNILSIKIKWVMIMAFIVATTLTLCGGYFYQQQQETMLKQVYQYGSSLTKFIATETAESVLSEDWANIELFINDNVNDQNLLYLKIMDHNNIIRGSNNDAEIGSQYIKPINIKNIIKLSRVRIKLHGTNKEPILDFSAPIIFQTTTIGYIHLGISQAPIEKLLLDLLWALALIAVIIIATVSITTYILSQQICRPIATLTKAMREIESGHYSYRIGNTNDQKTHLASDKKTKNMRRDEFGQLFTQFDAMAVNVQEEDEKKSTHKK